MSSNLYWEPIKPKNGKTLSDSTKFFLREAYSLGTDGCTLDESDKEYLCGARAATKDLELKADLDTLLSAIEKYGEVRVWEQY